MIVNKMEFTFKKAVQSLLVQRDVGELNFLFSHKNAISRKENKSVIKKNMESTELAYKKIFGMQYIHALCLGRICSYNTISTNRLTINIFTANFMEIFLCAINS